MLAPARFPPLVAERPLDTGIAHTSRAGSGVAGPPWRMQLLLPHPRQDGAAESRIGPWGLLYHKRR